MKKIVLILLALIVGLSAMTLEEAINSAQPGSYNGENYDKLVYLNGEVYTGGYEYIGGETGDGLNIMIVGDTNEKGGNAVIDLEDGAILIKNVSTRFDMYNVVVKNGGNYTPAKEGKENGIFHGALNFDGTLTAETSAKANISRCTFVDCFGAAIMNEDILEENITFDSNVFYNVSSLGWTTQAGNWIPDGVAILGYRWGGGATMANYATITNNLSYQATFEHDVNGTSYSGDFWQTCINCGGGDPNSRLIDGSYEGVFTDNITGIDPMFQNIADNNYFANATEAQNKGVLNPTSSINEGVVVESITLDGNYPNPFNPETTIKFSIENRSDVKFNVFNNSGKVVKSATYENMSAGKNSINFNALNLNSGVYFYSIEASNQVKTGKMVLVK
ncbi:MAG: hypothetical protein CSA15_02340 [Candidatus Delongbacteria bacterium]|nr:MAG: hypothetical protein CSA15_02340 [Candidatus Delongbacteria bacterium]